MRYFEEIKLWKIVLLNICIGFLMSTPTLIGLILFFGSSGPPIMTEQIVGLGILIGIIFIIFLSNFILWNVSKKNLKSNKANRNTKINFLKLALILSILILSVGSFFIPGILDMWLKLYM